MEKRQFIKALAPFPSVQLPPTKQDVLEQQDTIQPVALNRSTPPVSHKGSNDLSTSMQMILNIGLSRLQAPNPEGLFTRGLKAVQQGNNTLGLLSILTLTNALGLLIVSFAYYVSSYGTLALETVFFLGLLLIFVPNVVQLMSSSPSRFERICLLCGVGLCFYLVQFMISPFRASSFDEFLHWRTAADIARTGHLFSYNSMLPVSPYYPGLEIITNALSTTSGMSIFQADIFVISTARILMILSLFLFYEQITESSRMASIATIIYMTNPHFLFFDALFNYETLALPLASVLLCILARSQTMNRDYRWVLFTVWLVLLAVTITHHMTDYVFDGLLIIWTATSLFQTSSRDMRKKLVTITMFGVLFSLAYAFLIKGNPVWGYLSTYYGSAFNELVRIFTGSSVARPLFANSTGQATPIWDRLLMLAAVALVAFGIPFGLVSLWHQRRYNALSLMLGITSLTYPITQAFRFTKFGAEITDRSAAFLFLSIAYVLTIFIVHFWPTRKLSFSQTLQITCTLSVVFLGGVALEAGPSWSNLPGPYIVVADVRSIEPEGIQAASWTLLYLGPDNRVATDRINRELMSTYGTQHIVTGTENRIDTSPIFYSSQFSAKQIAILRHANVRYLVVDLRLSTSLPLDGFYFESGESGAFQLVHPISKNALTKFNAIPKIKRIFDSGDIVIYDMGALVSEPTP